MARYDLYIGTWEFAKQIGDRTRYPVVFDPVLFGEMPWILKRVDEGTVGRVQRLLKNNCHDVYVSDHDTGRLIWPTKSGLELDQALDLLG